jgi:hypothetical protein
MIPQIARVRVHSGQDRRIRLWIPLLPLYLVLSPLVVLFVLVLVVACVVYRVNPLRALGAGARLLSACSGFQLEIQQGRTGVLVKLT